MKKIYFAILPTLYAASASAQTGGFFVGRSRTDPNISGVPEISALEGTAALAAVAAILLFVCAHMGNERRLRVGAKPHHKAAPNDGAKMPWATNQRPKPAAAPALIKLKEKIL